MFLTVSWIHSCLILRRETEFKRVCLNNSSCFMLIFSMFILSCCPEKWGCSRKEFNFDFQWILKLLTSTLFPATWLAVHTWHRLRGTLRQPFSAHSQLFAAPLWSKPSTTFSSCHSADRRSLSLFQFAESIKWPASAESLRRRNCWEINKTIIFYLFAHLSETSIIIVIFDFWALMIYCWK